MPFTPLWKGRESARVSLYRRQPVEPKTVAVKFHSETVFRDGNVCDQLFGGRAFSRPVPSWRSVRWPDCCCKVAVLFIFLVFFPATIHSADDPASLLKQNFESAKSALAAGDLPGAEREFKQAIALGLRQLGTLSLAESRYDEAARDLDEALKLAPDNPDIAADAAIAWFRAGDIKKAR